MHRSSKRRLFCEERGTEAARRRFWSSRRARRGERFWRDADFSRPMAQRTRGRKKKRSNTEAQRRKTYGSDVVVDQAGGLRGGHSAGAGNAAGVLAGATQGALEVFVV